MENAARFAPRLLGKGRTGLPRQLLTSLMIITLLAACSEDKKAQKPAERASDESTQDDGETESTVPVDKPVAEVTGDIAGLTMDVMPLRRSGETVTLKFQITNSTDTTVIVQREFVDQARAKTFDGEATVDGVTLTDDAGQKRYLVLRDSAGACVCSTDLFSVEAGDTASYFAKFPAPPKGVKVMSVAVPHFDIVDAVEIK